MPVFIETNLRKNARLDQIQNGTPLPNIEALAFGSGDPPADPNDYATLTILVNQEFTTVDGDAIVKERISDQVLKITGGTKVEGSYVIKEIGLLDTNGDLCYYTPYMESSGGLAKGEGFALTVTAIISLIDGVDSIVFEYQTVDVNAIVNQIVTDAQAQMDVYLQGLLIPYQQHNALLASIVYQQQQQINQIKQLQGM